MFKRLVPDGSILSLCSRLSQGAFLLILCILVWCGLGSRLYGQATSASISGHVSDPGNAAVPDATIQMTNLDTQIVTNAKTGTTGLYIFPSLPPGNYKVKVSKTGFRDTRARGSAGSRCLCR